MVVLVPVPVVVTAPGVLVKVHVPLDGNPLNTTLPVANAQVGCVMVPTVGADGVAGCALITTLPDATEVHPTELVTVYVYVPATKPEMVVLDVFPVIPPGLIVQLPDGNPVKITLPVANAQVGCVMVPTVGAVGVAGCAFITTFADATEVHPTELVTV